MKKICKMSLCVMLCAVIVILPLCLVACDKDKNGISQFYGVYEADSNYCTVYFYPQSENKDYELVRHGRWEITSFGEGSFTYIESLNGNRLAEKECDAFLLKSVKRLMSIMGNKVTLSEGLIFLNDSDWDVNYDYVRYTGAINATWALFQNKINVGGIICPKEQGGDLELYVSLYDDYIIDENGVEWEIFIGKSFKKCL